MKSQLKCVPSCSSRLTCTICKILQFSLEPEQHFIIVPFATLKLNNSGIAVLYVGVCGESASFALLNQKCATHKKETHKIIFTYTDT